MSNDEETIQGLDGSAFAAKKFLICNVCGDHGGSCSWMPVERIFYHKTTSTKSWLHILVIAKSQAERG